LKVENEFLQGASTTQCKPHANQTRHPPHPPFENLTSPNQVGAQIAIHSTCCEKRQKLTAPIRKRPRHQTLFKKQKPMTITLGDKASTLALNAHPSALERSAETTLTAQGQNFGQLMTDMRLQQPNAIIPSAVRDPTDGQQLADAMVFGADGPWGLQSESLKEMRLGPNLNVITPQTAAPDSQSLQAFARAQGLDEKAVSWLFGTSAAGSAGLFTATADETKSVDTDITQDTPLIQLLRMPPAAAVWMQRGLVHGVLQEAVSPAKNPKISESELDLGADWGAQLLNDLFSQEGTTSQGTNTTGTQGTAYANFAARWDAQAANRAEVSNAGHSAPTEPTHAARSERIQNLAEKMGQAVGQRILTEMEKGQWHLKLQLRPATLGHIEVEMMMRSGEFDAVFTAPNATTRELLQDGMAKLRDTLSQMGMDVAYIDVRDGRSGQSGGNPTPGFRKGKTSETQSNAQVTDTETTRAPLIKSGKDGLDVLV
jgi:hypothetical protein